MLRNQLILMASPLLLTALVQASDLPTAESGSRASSVGQLENSTSWESLLDSVGVSDCIEPSCGETVSYGIDRAATTWQDRLEQTHGIELNGMLSQSFNTNSRNPANPPNGAGNQPGGLFLYRNDEYMLNWLGVSVGRETDTSKRSWDTGFQFDAMYGTDYFSMQSRGLEQEGDGTNRWNSDSGSGLVGGLMGLAVPQIYGSVAHDDVTVKAGKFFHPLGFSRYAPNLNNIANTRSYSAIFGEFATVTGVHADLTVNDQLTLSGAVHRGDANWEDNNDVLSTYWGFNWISKDGNCELRYNFDVGREDNAGLNDQYVHGIVFQSRFCEKWLYLLHNNFGYINNGGPAGIDARWYGVEQQVAFEISEKAVVGIRYEWFHDIDGAQVAPSPGPGVFHLLDIGGTYRFTEKFWVRPEFRWEGYDGDSGVGAGPFGNGRNRDQFIASVSVLIFL